MWKFIKVGLGLEKATPYQKDYIYRRNLRASIFMSAIVVLIVISALWNLVVRSVYDPGSITIGYIIRNYGVFLVLLGLSFFMVVFANNHLFSKNPNKDSKIGYALMLIFSIICLWYGVKLGVRSYTRGEQILEFLSMVVFIFCILTLPPLFSIVALGAIFIIFYLLVSKGIDAHYVDFEYKLFTMWIVMVFVQINMYFQSRMVAKNAEEITEYSDYLESISTTDNLTGLYNKHYFTLQCTNVLMSEGNVASDFCLIYMNIENFKGYNAKYGFSMGNEFLMQVGQEIKKTFPNDPVGRTGDDHFVLMTKYGGVEAKISLLNKKVSALAGEVKLELKAGCYKFKDEGENILLDLDYAHYAVGTLRKMSDQIFREYDEKMAKSDEIKQFVLSHIDSAVANGHIKVYYQPIMWCKNRKVCGFEALARWEDPIRGVLPPYQFIDTLEEYRMIDKIDKSIVEQVCIRIREALDNKEPLVPISVNFSRLDFELYDVQEYVNEMCEKYKVPHKYIDIEVTESALSEKTGTLYQTLNCLSDEEHSLWLDDFGSGYSSLNVLKDYHFDIMKIDMVFMRNFDTNKDAKTIVSAVIDLSKAIGMQALTEGVETEEQFEYLRNAGCIRAQGYLFSPPRPWKNILELFDEGKLEWSDEFIEECKERAKA